MDRVIKAISPLQIQERNQLNCMSATPPNALIRPHENAQVVISSGRDSSGVVAANEVVRNPCQVLSMYGRLPDVRVLHEVELITDPQIEVRHRHGPRMNRD